MASLKVYFDSNIVIAALSHSHQDHRKSLPALTAAQQRKIQAHISAHGLAETYAVLTALPVSPRILPSQAVQMLRHSVLPYFSVITLGKKEYAAALESCAAGGWISGRIYDALHLAAAKKAGCDRIYTFDKHFLELAPELTTKIVPPPAN